MPAALLTELEQQARALGFDLFGVVDAEQFDASQPVESRCGSVLPACGTAIVLGRGRPTATAVASLGELERMLRRAGLRARAAVALRSPISLACLGEAAGFGIVSPVIHRLLHPRFGPWVTVHGVLLVQGRPFGAIADASIAASFHPCCKCPKPCVAACPAGVHDGLGASHFDRCHDHRHGGGCTSNCQVVRTCPIGAETAFEPGSETERHRAESQLLAYRHGRSVLQTLRRAFGL